VPHAAVPHAMPHAAALPGPHAAALTVPREVLAVISPNPVAFGGAAAEEAAQVETTAASPTTLGEAGAVGGAAAVGGVAAAELVDAEAAGVAHELATVVAAQVETAAATLGEAGALGGAAVVLEGSFDWSQWELLGTVLPPRKRRSRTKAPRLGEFNHCPSHLLLTLAPHTSSSH
jgi:hypothetical protein